jgi:tetratricopeptide (TPR) repeat protein
MVGSFLLNTTSASVDERKALVWLTKAADAGQTNAQVDLANYLLEKADDPGSRARAFELLNQAAGTDNLEAKYRLAALLASDPDASRRDPARALELLEKVMSGKEIDPTTLEVRAAARAMIGDFKAALADEEHAIRLATRYGWDLAPLEARHALYEKGAAWTGDLLAP